ncbi:hypothetical protein CSUI_002149 [Cystoisospora suis]|uniref:Uncharacterized protein n=1 Tax=Cystoisospora suis TaxID=483139 RepID=A0A2C6L9W9_9APIC|nr:hypothetical protein CSUI_002149 [Cystoisospora suis]
MEPLRSFSSAFLNWRSWTSGGRSHAEGGSRGDSLDTAASTTPVSGPSCRSTRPAASEVGLVVGGLEPSMEVEAVANESGYRCVVNPAKSRVQRSRLSLFGSSDPNADSLGHHSSSLIGRLLCSPAVPDGDEAYTLPGGVCAAPRSTEGTSNVSRHYFSGAHPADSSQHNSKDEADLSTSGEVKSSKCCRAVPPLKLRSEEDGDPSQARSRQAGDLSAMSVCSPSPCSVACCPENPSVSSGIIGFGYPTRLPQESDPDAKSLQSQRGLGLTDKQMGQGEGSPYRTLASHCRRSKKKHLFTRFYAATVPAAVLDADKQEGLTPHQERVRSRVKLPDLGGETFDYPLPPAILYHSRAADAVSPEMLGLQKPVLPKRDSGVFHLQGERFEEAMKIPLTPRSVMALPLPERKRLLYNMLCCFCIELAEGISVRQLTATRECLPVHCRLSPDLAILELDIRSGRVLEFPITQIQAVYTLARKQPQSFSSTDSREGRASKRGKDTSENRKLDSDTSASSSRTWGRERSRGEQGDETSSEDDEAEREESRNSQPEATNFNEGRSGGDQASSFFLQRTSAGQSVKEHLPRLNLGLLQQRHKSALSHQVSASIATPHITPSTPTYAQLPSRNKAAWKQMLEEEEEKELDKGPPQFIVVLDFSHRKLAFVFSDRTQAGTFELGLALVAKASHEQHSALASIAAAADSFPYTPRAARVLLHALAGTTDRQWSGGDGRSTPRMPGAANSNAPLNRGGSRGMMNGVFGGDHTYATSLSASTVAAVAAAAVAHSNSSEGEKEWSVVRAHDFDQHPAIAGDQGTEGNVPSQNFVRLSSFDQDAQAVPESEDDAEGKGKLEKQGDARPGEDVKESDGVRSRGEKPSTGVKGGPSASTFSDGSGCITVSAKQSWKSPTNEADFGIVTIRRRKEE